jgi:glycerate kinase
MELAGLPALLDKGGVKLVITGEGEINRQSLRGKVPVGVARLAQAHQVPVLVLAGSVKLDPEEARSAGISAMLSITDGPLTLAEAMAQTAALLEKTAAQAARLLKIGLAGI